MVDRKRVFWVYLVSLLAIPIFATLFSAIRYLYPAEPLAGLNDALRRSVILSECNPETMGIFGPVFVVARQDQKIWDRVAMIALDPIDPQRHGHGSIKFAYDGELAGAALYPNSYLPDSHNLAVIVRLDDQTISEVICDIRTHPYDEAWHLWPILHHSLGAVKEVKPWRKSPPKCSKWRNESPNISSRRFK